MSCKILRTSNKKRKKEKYIREYINIVDDEPTANRDNKGGNIIFTLQISQQRKRGIVKDNEMVEETLKDNRVAVVLLKGILMMVLVVVDTPEVKFNS